MTAAVRAAAEDPGVEKEWEAAAAKRIPVEEPLSADAGRMAVAVRKNPAEEVPNPGSATEGRNPAAVLRSAPAVRRSPVAAQTATARA